MPGGSRQGMPGPGLRHPTLQGVTLTLLNRVSFRVVRLGPGWFGEKDSRIYEIVYRDRDGHVPLAHVKSSMMSGVYLKNDQIIEPPPAGLRRGGERPGSPGEARHRHDFSRSRKAGR